MLTDPRIQGLLRLILAALRPPPGAGRIALALTMGVLTHLAFAAGVLTMITAMFFGMSETQTGRALILCALGSVFRNTPGLRTSVSTICGTHLRRWARRRV